jgi:hypothetical protein
VITPIEPDQINVIIGLVTVTLPLSVITTSLGLFIFLYIRLKFPRLANRVTFRLAFAAMASDLGYTAVQWYGLSQLSPSPGCTFTAWAFVFFSLTSLFFPTCIALNLHAIFIKEYRGSRDLEKYYFIGTLSLASLLSLIPFADQNVWF